MNKKLYLSIIKRIVLAQYYSDSAKADDRNKKEYYYLKSNCIQKAISLLNTNNIPEIRYKETTDHDQNGYDSRIIYFNINYFGEILQVSFHNFNGLNMPTKGTKTIEWSGVIGESQRNCIKLDKRFNLHIMDGKNVIKF